MTHPRQQFVDRVSRDYTAGKLSREFFKKASTLAGWLLVVEEHPKSVEARAAALVALDELEQEHQR